MCAVQSGNRVLADVSGEDTMKKEDAELVEILNQAIEIEYARIIHAELRPRTECD
jgi:hypothetical protein